MPAAFVIVKALLATKSDERVEELCDFHKLLL